MIINPPYLLFMRETNEMTFLASLTYKLRSKYITIKTLNNTSQDGDKPNMSTCHVFHCMLIEYFTALM